ncbi:MAG TPA: glucan biosynthesis protein D [Nevskiaceae bacterium]|nr:glucan biosynthesis protein D [Nevskiaceae bacterium]
MSPSLPRRDLLRAGLALGALGLTPGRLAAAAAAADEGPFDYAALKGRARQLSQRAYVPPADDLPPKLRDISYDDYQSLRFQPERALWLADGLPFRAQLHHRGLYFKERVRLHELHQGRSRPLGYDPTYFDTRKARLGRMPSDLGYAGFRVQSHLDWGTDVCSFLGASYFRAIGADKQYGLSARGLALNTGEPEPEEFPRFSEFWLERPARGADRFVIYALLESPSVTGAYRFEIVPGNRLLMEVDAALYPRTAVKRFGVAPLTSMYQCGENDRRMGNDFRPEIHDSDGLALHTGAGEWIWRPLVNPPVNRLNSFADDNPRGFGLLQRDRDFSHYQDDGAWYDRRPSVWVEPRHGWGRGSVQLFEIPTLDETFDNIVAFWVPEKTPQPGEEHLFAYRLHWGREAPVGPSLATVAHTRTGIGGPAGVRRRYYSQRFAVDFTGGPIPLLGREEKVEAVISSSRGRIEQVSARPLIPAGGYRAIFDIVPADDSQEPYDLRLFLRQDGQALSETWLYQWTPPPVERREF